MVSMLSRDECAVTVKAHNVSLSGALCIPEGAEGLVVFAHGSGSSRHSPRNRYVATVLREAGLGTLLFDLLTADEEAEDMRTAHLRFNIGLLANRLVEATDWLLGRKDTRDLGLGYFGASTGSAAALVAAAQKPDVVGAIVSRGGRPDLAAEWLSRVRAPTLLIVGSNDFPVIGMNRAASQRLNVVKKLVLVPGATHLFEEPGTLEEVARLASQWFVTYLRKRAPAATAAGAARG